MNYIMKTDSTHRFNRAIVIPFLGETKISENGTFEVESLELAQQIENLEAGFYISDESILKTANVDIKPQVEDEDLSKSDDDSDQIKPQVTEDVNGLDLSDDAITQTDNQVVDAEDNELILSLRNMKVAELKALAAPFPDDEWQTLKKDELVSYLESKLKD